MDKKTIEKSAWNSFWNPATAGQPQTCLPGGLSHIEKAQDGFWAEFANGLSRKARVLDLATGDGAVLRKLKKARKDLKLVGVDYADTLPKAPTGLQLRPNVDMEHLPFGQNSFDAVTSQFGYEYGDTQRIVAEVARVVKPHGKIGLVIHHRESPILETNIKRAKQLRWAIEDEKICDKAKSFLAARVAVPLPLPDSFEDMARTARDSFGPQSAGFEFSAAIVQTLKIGMSRPAAISIDIINELEEQANSEVGRIVSLNNACQSIASIEMIADQLVKNGFDMATPATMRISGASSPVAWLLQGTRL